MGALRDLFDMFVQVRKLKDEKRKEYFDHVVLSTFEQLRTVHNDFLSLLIEGLELLDDSGDVQQVLKRLQKGRLRMQSLRQEIYEKARVHVSRQEHEDITLMLAQRENEDVRAFLLACTDYFETRSTYAHALENMLVSLSHAAVKLEKLSLLYERQESRRREEGPGRHIAEAEVIMLDIRNRFESALTSLGKKWQRLAREFAEVHRHFA